jgi:hypothetical protein
LGWRINNIRIGSIEGSKLVGNIKHVLDGLKEHDFVYAKNEDALKLKNRDKLLDQWITAFADELKLMPDENGKVEIREPYWTVKTDLPNIAPCLVVYTDLMITGDPRNIKIAEEIYAEATTDKA